MNGLDESVRLPSFWKFSSNFVNDPDYCQLISANYNVWLEAFNEVLVKRVLWDLIKYRIRQCTIKYSKTKACQRKAKLQEVEECIKECSYKCDKDHSPQILRNWSLSKQNMRTCTTLLHRELSYALVQLGTKWGREITNTFSILKIPIKRKPA